MSKIVNGMVVAFAALGWIAAGSVPAMAQTRPAVTNSPVGNSYIAGIDAPTAKFMQTVAWETVQDYYGK